MQNEFFQVAGLEQVYPVLEIRAGGLGAGSDGLALEFVVVATRAGFKEMGSVLLKRIEWLIYEYIVSSHQ